MRKQIICIVTLGIALTISPAVGFARGGGSGGGGGGGGSSHSSTGAGGSGSNTPYFGVGHPGGPGSWHQKPPPGNNNKAGSKPVNCKSGGEGCYHQQ